MILIRMICEFCKSSHSGDYGSGRFCNAFCARAYSSNLKREETNRRVSETLKGRPSNFKGKTGLKHSAETKQRISETVRSKLPKLTQEEQEAKKIARRKRKMGILRPIDQEKFRQHLMMLIDN